MGGMASRLFMGLHLSASVRAVRGIPGKSKAELLVASLALSKLMSYNSVISSLYSLTQQTRPKKLKLFSRLQ